jgi:hypothetical protein
VVSVKECFRFESLGCASSGDADFDPAPDFPHPADTFQVGGDIAAVHHFEGALRGEDEADGDRFAESAFDGFHGSNRLELKRWRARKAIRTITWEATHAMRMQAAIFMAW